MPSREEGDFTSSPNKAASQGSVAPTRLKSTAVPSAGEYRVAFRVPNGIRRVRNEITEPGRKRSIREYFDHFQSVRSTISDGKCTEVDFQKSSGHFTEVKWS